MRLFIALDIDGSIRTRISRFMEGVSGFVPDARWVRPESLHITVKFIGEKPEAAVEQITEALRTIRSSRVEIQFHGYGFFPSAKAPRVFWLGIQGGSQLAALAAIVDDKMESQGIPKDEHDFSPHLTLARGKGRSGSPGWRKGDGPHRGFQRLQEKLDALPMPEFGTMTAREFFLYRSQLSPKGSTYTKLAGFGLT